MKNIIYLLCLFLPLWVSCEYESDGVHFVEIEKPGDYVEFSMNLNDVEPGGTIYIFGSTSVTYTVDVQASEQLSLYITFEGQTYQVGLDESGSGSFFISDYLNSTTETLKITVAMRSGSGSVADLLGMEGYYTEAEYTVKFIENIYDKIKIQHRKNADGFLELYWDELAAALPTNVSYEVSFYNYGLGTNETLTTTDSYVVDTSYTCDHRYYNFAVIIPGQYRYTSDYVISEPQPIITSRLIDNKYHIEWSEPLYNCDFYIQWDETYDVVKSVVVSGKDLSFDISVLPFQTDMNGAIYIFPVDHNGGYDYPYHFPMQYFHSIFENNTKNWGYFTGFTYNQKDNILYTHASNELKAINLADKSVLNQRTLIGESIYTLSTSLTSSKMAVVTSNRIFIFNDYTLLEPATISLKHALYQKIGALFLKDDKLALFFYNENNDLLAVVYDTHTNSELYGFIMEEGVTSTSFGLRASGDGKYITKSGNDGIFIYEVGNDGATLTYTDSGYYLGEATIPGQPDQMLFKEGDNITIRQLNDFSLVRKSLPYPNVTIGNVDPVSGLLFFFTSNKHYIYNINTMQEVYTYDVDNMSRYRLFNNIVIRDSGDYYDILNYLEK